MIIETVVLAIDMVLRRWWLFLLPLLLAVPLAALMVYKSPTTYVARSLVLLQFANRGAEFGGGSQVPRTDTADQVGILETWLKSDHVLEGILPLLLDGKPVVGPKELEIELNKLRGALKLQVVRNSVLEIQFEGAKREGLGRKLEIIVSRLLEGLMRRDDGILTAAQLVTLNQSDRLKSASDALAKAIDQAGLDRFDRAFAQLKELHTLVRQQTGSEADRSNPPAATAVPATNASTAQTTGASAATDPINREQALRQQISADPEMVKELLRHYDEYAQAQEAMEALRPSGLSSSGNYVGIFDAPERISIIGRPRDPLFGENAARKLAILILMAACALGGGLVLIAELLDTRVRRMRDFEALSGLPVIARVPRL